MFKKFLLKQVLQSQLKHVPAAERDKLMAIVEKDPEFFVKLATDAQEKIKGGMEQTAAMAAVMKENEAKLRELVGDTKLPPLPPTN